MTAHAVHRLTEKLYNTPHFITGTAFDNAISYLTQRNVGEMAIIAPEKVDAKDLEYNQDTGVGIIPVHGPLTYIQYSGWCGERPASYQGIRNDVSSMIEAGAHTIVLDADSGGGEAYGMFECAQSIRKMCDDAGVKLITYVDGIAASAMYGLACVSHEVIVNPQAEVGSIGVVVKLRNYNKAMKKAGVTDTYVYAGNNKIPFSADGEFKKEFLGSIQERVDDLYVQFVNHVSEYRDIPIEAVRNTEAGMFSAAKAIELGLADKALTIEEFGDYIASLADQKMKGARMPLGMFGGRKAAEAINKEEQMYKEQFEQAQAELTELKGQMEEQLAQMASLQEQYDAAKASLEASEALVADLEAKAKAREESDRKAALKAAGCSDETVATMMTAIGDLPKEKFNAVVAGVAASNAVAMSNELFEEVGVSGEGEDVDAKAEATSNALELTRKAMQKLNKA